MNTFPKITELVSNNSKKSSPVYSYDLDVILTQITLESHYSPALKSDPKSHIFLSPIDARLTPMWFKVKEKDGEIEGVNLGVNQMVEEAGIDGASIMNKSGRVIAGVPKNVMQQITCHRAQSSLDKYDETGDLDTQSAQLVSRIPYNVRIFKRT